MEQSFEDFLKKTRKRNGEKFLPKSINQYVATIERHKQSMYNKTISELINYMNDKIINFRGPTLRAAFRMYLIYLGVLEDDDRLKLLKSSKHNASALTSVRVLTEKSIPLKDLKLLYDSVDDEGKLIIAMFYDTAARCEEILTLKWRKITFYPITKNNISAEASVIGKGGKLRTVFISESTVQLLRKLRQNIQEDDLIFQFRMSDGDLYKRRDKALYDWFTKKTKDIIGVKHSIHHLRHSKLTHLAEHGTDILSLASIAGHSSIVVTTIYAKMSKAIAKRGYEEHTESLDEK